jgi:nucleoside 2-deoxyribosyltransferase
MALRVECPFGDGVAAALGKPVAAIMFLDQPLAEQPLDRLVQAVAERPTEVCPRQPNGVCELAKTAIRRVPKRPQQLLIQGELTHLCIER